MTKPKTRHFQSISIKFQIKLQMAWLSQTLFLVRDRNFLRRMLSNISVAIIPDYFSQQREAASVRQHKMSTEWTHCRQFQFQRRWFTSEISNRLKKCCWYVVTRQQWARDTNSFGSFGVGIGSSDEFNFHNISYWILNFCQLSHVISSDKAKHYQPKQHKNDRKVVFMPQCVWKCNSGSDYYFKCLKTRDICWLWGSIIFTWKIFSAFPKGSQKAWNISSHNFISSCSSSQWLLLLNLYLYVTLHSYFLQNRFSPF